MQNQYGENYIHFPGLDNNLPFLRDGFQPTSHCHVEFIFPPATV